MTPELHLTPDETSSDRSASATALSLLGAVSFSLTFSTLTWSDDEAAAQLIHAPVHRIPNTPEALNQWLGGDARRIRDTARESLSKDGDVYKITYPMDGFDGSSLWIEEQGQRLSGEGVRPNLVVGLLRDVTERRQSEMKAAWSAHHDAVTGLWNRARFIEALEYEMAASELRPEAGYAAALKLTGLEDIRTSVDPAAGDILMTQIAKKLTTYLPLPNSAARVGPATYAILLPGRSRSDAQQTVREIADWMSSEPHTTSFGDLYTDCDVSGLELSLGSDAGHTLALLESQLRPAGKGLDFSSSTVSPLPSPSRDIEVKDILAALEVGALSLAYQPIICAKTRAVNHFECLLRLADDEGMPRSAAKFIIAAEELGYVHLLDRKALEMGSLTLKQFPDIHLAFNVSAGTVKSELAVERYLAGLRALGADAHRVTLELTETLALDDPLDASRFAAAAREMGCKFAIDDFGTGHTTFQNLMSIEADIIKIDGSMVQDLSSAPHKQTFVRMMVDLAKTFGVETVAEMVNSEADAALMTRMGITYFQGYMFGMPAPVPEFGGLKQAL